MNHGTGALAVLAAGLHPAEALTMAGPCLPRRWSLHAQGAPWGTLLVGGPSTYVEKHLAVGGTPVSHPWGVPVDPLDLRVLWDRYERYGLQVIQLAAGPFVVAHAEQGTLASALNGIVPIFVGRGRQVAVGTHRQIVEILARCSGAEQAPAGAVAHIDGSIQNVAAFQVREALPLVRLDALDKEIAHHIGQGFRPWRPRIGPFGAATSRFKFHRSPGGSVIASPRPRVLQSCADDASIFRALHQEVSGLWWEAAMRSTLLFVPAFERPALDIFGLAGGGR